MTTNQSPSTTHAVARPEHHHGSLTRAAALRDTQRCDDLIDEGVARLTALTTIAPTCPRGHGPLLHLVEAIGCTPGNGQCRRPAYIKRPRPKSSCYVWPLPTPYWLCVRCWYEVVG